MYPLHTLILFFHSRYYASQGDSNLPISLYVALDFIPVRVLCVWMIFTKPFSIFSNALKSIKSCQSTKIFRSISTVTGSCTNQPHISELDRHRWYRKRMEIKNSNRVDFRNEAKSIPEEDRTELVAKHSLEASAKDYLCEHCWMLKLFCICKLLKKKTKSIPHNTLPIKVSVYSTIRRCTDAQTPVRLYRSCFQIVRDLCLG